MSGSKGLGLGLTIVERACATLGQDLGLRSTLGRGSCFSVEIERIAIAPQEPVPAAQPREARPTNENVVILLVENDENRAVALTLMIED